MEKILEANINRYMTLANMKQYQLAEYLGITRQTFKRKCDNYGFTVRELGIIAQRLHIKVADLVKGV